MWSESTRYSFSGGIEYPHFGQRVLSDAFTLSRLIFYLLGMRCELYVGEAVAIVQIHGVRSYIGDWYWANCSQNVGICWSAQGSRTRSTAGHLEDDFNVFAICQGFAPLSPVLLLSCLESHAWRVSTHGFGKRKGAL
jgi:hypothetical protein